MKQCAYWMALAVFCFSISACDKKPAPAPVKIAGGNQTWFDAPLDGMNIPLEPYEVVLHTYATGGVSQVELSINGSAVANLKADGVNGKLATYRYKWRPEAPGNFILDGRAQGTNGHWGGPASVSVTVSDFTDTPTPTETPTITPTPTITRTPTITPTITKTPSKTPTASNTAPAEFNLTRQVSTSQFYAGSCGLGEITVQVQVSDPGRVRSVVLFQKLSGVTGWNDGNAMHSDGNGNFSLTINGTSVPDYQASQSATWAHQVVATDATGAIIGRSKAYTDVTLTTCGAPVRQPLPRVPSVTPVLQYQIQPQIELFSSPTPISHKRQIIK